jgi:hypothetical protein
VKENKFYYGDVPHYIGLGDEQKQMVSMGAYVIILPDKVWFNTADNTYGQIEADFTRENQLLKFSICDKEGNQYHKVLVQATEPQKEDGWNGLKIVWVDISESPYTLHEWNASTEKWDGVTAVTAKITADGITGFAAEDYVQISGLDEFYTDEFMDMKSASPKDLRELNGTRRVVAAGYGYIVVEGTILANYEKAFPKVSISRKMPDMNYIVEANNRLWGCKYGEVDGKNLNEIYCSKLGDFKNWRCYANGISTDSWTASVGTDGPFTGAAAPFGKPIFFKENCIHEVYGEYPANFGIQTTVCEGVQDGSSNSIAVVDGRLYYKAERGVMVYDGSMPTLISRELGDLRYGVAAAGVLGSKYYIDMRLKENGSVVVKPGDTGSLFVYDAQKGLWHREKGIGTREFVTFDGNLYSLSIGGTVLFIGDEPHEGRAEGDVKWSAVTGLMGLDNSNAKYITRMAVRLALAFGAKVRIFVEYDSSGVWQCLYTATGTNLRTYTVPMRIRRCDHFRLKLEGTGDCRVYAITKIMEEGSMLF